MKKYLLITIGFCLLIATASKADSPEKEGTKLNLWIPGFIVKLGTGIADDFVDKQDMEAHVAMDFAKNIGDINVCVREGDYYNVSDAKINRKLARMDKKNYVPLITVFEDETHVKLSIKQKKNGNIKKLVVLVDETDETYVYARINCNISAKDIQKLVNNIDFAEL